MGRDTPEGSPKLRDHTHDAAYFNATNIHSGLDGLLNYYPRR